MPGDISRRSELPPTWLVSNDANACGLLEDTLRAKRLTDDQGQALISAHLSYFAFNDATSAVNLIYNALNVCAEKQYPALFVALKNHHYAEIEPSLNRLDYKVYGATIYGHMPSNNFELNVNTSEI